jgi:phosphoribosylaminoimidazole-succinocarboxamide synthase
MTSALHTSALTSLPLLARGKVRDNYAVGHDRILMVASDRISAFDVIMGEPIPGKGALLTKMALFWFELLKDVAPNHLTGQDPVSVVTPEERAQVEGRAMLVKKLKPLPVVTPATKADVGDHDENISYDKMVEIIGADLAAQVRTLAIKLYQKAADYALTKGIIIADTKFEFGLDEQGTLTVMDEVLTPDSSRFWPVEGYEKAFNEGANPPSYDKQFVRDWLEQATVNGQPWDKTAPSPALPQEVIDYTAAKYQEALTRLTGQ